MNKEDFEKIISNHELTVTEKSDRVMELLRKDSILLPKSYVESFCNEDKKVTIDPEKIVKDPLKISESYIIYGYSFGPFDPEFYFSSDNKFRFVWLLKEPFSESLEDIKNMISDKEGHDQAKEYALWKIIKKKKNSITRVIHLTLMLLRGLEPENKLWDEESYETFQEVMKHICILEVNHFPGLFFGENSNSNDNLIKSYAEENKEVIEKLVKFYLPGDSEITNVLIGGNTLKYFFNKDYDENHYPDNIVKGILQQKVTFFKNLLTGFEVTKLPGKISNEIYIDDKGNFLIDAYHPAPNKKNKSYEFTNEMAKFDGERIRLIKSYKGTLNN